MLLVPRLLLFQVQWMCLLALAIDVNDYLALARKYILESPHPRAAVAPRGSLPRGGRHLTRL